jgi:hypothetical protein
MPISAFLEGVVRVHCRYYEYTLLSTAEDGSLIEDKSKTLFHILPSPGTTDSFGTALWLAAAAVDFCLYLVSLPGWSYSHLFSIVKPQRTFRWPGR